MNCEAKTKTKTKNRLYMVSCGMHSDCVCMRVWLFVSVAFLALKLHSCRSLCVFIQFL